MLLRLLLAFTLIPLAEIYLLVRVGSHIGAWPTVALVLGTGMAGAWLGPGPGTVRHGPHPGEHGPGRAAHGRTGGRPCSSSWPGWCSSRPA